MSPIRTERGLCLSCIAAWLGIFIVNLLYQALWESVIRSSVVPGDDPSLTIAWLFLSQPLPYLVFSIFLLLIPFHEGRYWWTYFACSVTLAQTIQIWLMAGFHLTKMHQVDRDSTLIALLDLLEIAVLLSLWVVATAFPVWLRTSTSEK